MHLLLRIMCCVAFGLVGFSNERQLHRSIKEMERDFAYRLEMPLCAGLDVSQPLDQWLQSRQQPAAQKLALLEQAIAMIQPDSTFRKIPDYSPPALPELPDITIVQPLKMKADINPEIHFGFSCHEKVSINLVGIL